MQPAFSKIIWDHLPFIFHCISNSLKLYAWHFPCLQSILFFKQIMSHVLQVGKNETSLFAQELFSNHRFCSRFHLHCNPSFAVVGLIVTGTNIYRWGVWTWQVGMEKLFISADLRLLRACSVKEPCVSFPPSCSPRSIGCC